MNGVGLTSQPIGRLVDKHGGALRNGAGGIVRGVAPIRSARQGELAPLFSARYAADAVNALGRGALLLVDDTLSTRDDVVGLPGWFHPQASWVLATLLGEASKVQPDPVIGEGCFIGPGAYLYPGVTLGARVVIGAGAVIGAPGFGFATGPDGATIPIPQLGGVVIEDDVHVGPLSTIAGGTLGPTVLRRGAKLDAQVHVGHNCEVGEGTIIAAQSGLAGSVIVGKGVLLGGQVGVADHITIGDGARVAAKSGVIGDVAAGAVVAGYPAVERQRWLRGLAELYRLVASRGPSSLEPSAAEPAPVVAPLEPSKLACIRNVPMADPTGRVTQPR